MPFDTTERKLLLKSQRHICFPQYIREHHHKKQTKQFSSIKIVFINFAVTYERNNNHIIADTTFFVNKTLF
jgi:hypothetical protein